MVDLNFVTLSTYVNLDKLFIYFDNGQKWPEFLFKWSIWSSPNKKCLARSYATSSSIKRDNSWFDGLWFYISS